MSSPLLYCSSPGSSLSLYPPAALPADVIQDQKDAALGYVPWRGGAYESFHFNLAWDALHVLLKQFELTLSESPELRDAGDMDGFRVTHAEITAKSGEKFEIQWCPGNQGWMKKLPSGGWGLLYNKDLS